MLLRRVSSMWHIYEGATLCFYLLLRVNARVDMVIATAASCDPRENICVFIAECSTIHLVSGAGVDGVLCQVLGHIAKATVPTVIQVHLRHICYCEELASRIPKNLICSQ